MSAEAVFSETLLNHLESPRNVGTLEPPAVTVRVENPICGDIMTLSAAVSGAVVSDVRFKVRGCTASIAAGSALTELLLGRHVSEVNAVGPDDVEAALDGLPNESKHAARLASDAAFALSERLASG
ncbi:MAG: iron-sulfur cluster assembly scaffold protein [Bryobacterales bacterium]|nr:iron-sulfur cluster assembly scaffold protein [Bryobacterales bacterium]